MLDRLTVWLQLLGLFICGTCSAQESTKPPLNKDQQLIIAAFELDVRRVSSLLADGANPDARLGFYDEHPFEDKWSLGYSPIGSDKWTPLLAVADSHRAPQPGQRTENTLEGLDAAKAKLKALDPKLTTERDARRVEIAKLLIAAKANLDLDDGYGTTALYRSAYNQFDDLSLLLIASNAKLNTKTRVYIDGDGDITPLHQAVGSPKVLKAMIERGANVHAVTTSGSTALHSAVYLENSDSVKLLLDAGANPVAIDKEGQPPAYWLESMKELGGTINKKQEEILQLLEAASKSRRDRNPK